MNSSPQTTFPRRHSVPVTTLARVSRSPIRPQSSRPAPRPHLIAALAIARDAAMLRVADALRVALLASLHRFQCLCTLPAAAAPLTRCTSLLPSPCACALPSLLRLLPSLFIVSGFWLLALFLVAMVARFVAHLLLYLLYSPAFSFSALPSFLPHPRLPPRLTTPHLPSPHHPHSLRNVALTRHHPPSSPCSSVRRWSRPIPARPCSPSTRPSPVRTSTLHTRSGRTMRARTHANPTSTTRSTRRPRSPSANSRVAGSSGDSRYRPGELHRDLGVGATRQFIGYWHLVLVDGQWLLAEPHY